MQIRCKLPVQTDWVPVSSLTFTLCVAQVASVLYAQFGGKREVAFVALFSWGLNELTPVNPWSSISESSKIWTVVFYVCLCIALALCVFSNKHIIIFTIVKKTNPPSPWGQGWGSTLSSHLGSRCVMGTLAFPRLLLMLTQVSTRSQSGPASWTPAPSGQGSNLLENWAMPR